MRGDGLPVKLRSEQMPANKEMVVNPDFLVNLMRLAKRLICPHSKNVCEKAVIGQGTPVLYSHPPGL